MPFYGVSIQYEMFKSSILIEAEDYDAAEKVVSELGGEIEGEYVEENGNLRLVSFDECNEEI